MSWKKESRAVGFWGSFALGQLVSKGAVLPQSTVGDPITTRARSMI